MQENTKQRIEWVDIFKALVIISVVVGHATGKYNMFIYQFHMAAFFFISGYTTNLKKRGIFETIWNKACTVLLPFFSLFAVGLLFITCLDKLGIYNNLFTDSFIGTWTAIKQLFLYGNNYVYWMGATWFLLVLFSVVILQKILYSVFGNWISLGYIISSILLLVLGYSIVKHHIVWQISLFSPDLMLIAQFYFFLGIVIKDKNLFQKISRKKWIEPVGILVCVCVMYYFAKINPATVDYPSRRFGTIFKDIIAATNGTLLAYFISKIIILLPEKIKKGIKYLGENTLGVLFFHFMFFKIGYGILVVFRVVPTSYLKNFTPTDDIGRSYWALFTVVSIVLSLLLWALMNTTRFMKILLGQEREVYDNCFIKMYELPLLNKLNKIKFPYNAEGFTQKFIKMKKEIISNKYISLIIIGLIITALSPMTSIGIIVNDELQARFRRMKGFVASIKEGFGLELSQGRPLRALAAIQNAVSFVSTNIYLYKTVQMIILLTVIVLFGYLLFKLFGNKKFSVFTCIAILVFLPITFEHAVPNAFVCLTAFPMIFLLVSLILFVYYVQKKKFSYLLCSMVLFFIAMLGYEFIVTFVLLYPIIYYVKIPLKHRSLHNAVKYNIAPIIIGFVYLGLMLGSSAMMSSHYSGVQIGFVSIKSSTDIIATLFKSSLPGYYLFNAKYNYLFNLYSADTFPIDSNILKSAGNLDMFGRLSILGKSIGKYILDNMINMRIVLLLLLLFLLLYYILPSRSRAQNKRPLSWLAILTGLAYMIIPATPNSITKLYQGNVTATNFTSLPISFFLYFSAMFTICYIIWKVLERMPGKYSIPATAVVICLYCLPIQAMNSTFSEVQSKNYNRLLSIEQLFETATLKNMNNQSVYAPALYETQNALAVHDTYWSQYAQLKGLHLEINKKNPVQESPFQIYYQEDKYFVLCGGNEVSVLSPSRIRGFMPVQVSEAKYATANFDNEAVDGSFYRYNFILSSEEGILNSMNNTNAPFADMSKEAGTTLKTARIINGYYADGWLEKNAEFRIQTGKEGKVILACYYPNEITGKETGTIFIDGNANPFKIMEESFTIELPAKAQSIVVVKIQSDFSFQAAAPDIRQLSFILSDAQGQ